MDGVHILWIGKYHQNEENQLHCHDFYQMIAVINGMGHLQINDTSYPITSQQVFFLPPHTRHSVSLIHTGKDIPHLLDIKFELTNGDLQERLSHLPYSLAISDFRRIQSCYEQILWESKNQLPLYSHAIHDYFCLLLIQVLRSESPAGIASPLPFENAVSVEIMEGSSIAPAVEFIQKNFTEKIGLEDLAQLTPHSKTTLIHKFRDAYGITPMKYMNQLRLEKAIHLLNNTEFSIAAISDQCGFHSVHYFSRCFKLSLGCSPLVYRKHHGQNYYFTSNEPTEPEKSDFEDL